MNDPPLLLGGPGWYAKALLGANWLGLRAFCRFLKYGAAGMNPPSVFLFLGLYWKITPPGAGGEKWPLGFSIMGISMGGMIFRGGRGLFGLLLLLG